MNKKEEKSSAFEDIDFQKYRLESLHEEQMLIAHVMHDPRLAKKIAMQLNPDDMWECGEYVEAAKAIIDAVHRVEGSLSRADVIQILEPILRRDINVSAEFGKRYREAEDDNRNGIFYLKRVIDRAGRRKILTELQPLSLLSDTWNTADALGKAREAMMDISRTSSLATGRGGLLSKDYHENVDALYDKLDGKVESGFDTGFKQLDDVIGQFKASSYNIIGARPSIGKTAVTINMVLALAKLGIRTMFMTLEVPYDSILELMACCHGGINKHALSVKTKAGQVVGQGVSQNTRSQLSDAYDSIHRLPIELHANCGYIDQIITLCEDAITRDRDPVQAIFVDYAQIVRTRKRTRTDLDRLNMISEGFRQLKSDHKVALFLAAQLNRKSADGIPKLEDLKGSGDFEQDADTVLLLHRPNKDLAEREDADPNIERTVYDDQLDIYVRKNRHGRTGRVSYRWTGSTGIISEMSEEDRKAADRHRVDREKKNESKVRNYSDGSMKTNTEDDLPF